MTDPGEPGAGTSGHGLWGGRFSEGMAPEMAALNRSLDMDFRFWPQDVRASRTWARALLRAGVLTHTEWQDIDAGLEVVASRLEGMDPATVEDEDIHSLVERMLVEEVGEAGAKLHTGRSRNDQAATDVRLWGMDAVADLDCNVSLLF
ncbi:MAG: lyase family protein, partial [Gammaproteobacteria bacterium]|nr:lyase family protein [Gammaproteobacteria bacterium]